MLTDANFLGECLVVRKCRHTFDPVKQSETPQRRAPRRDTPTEQIAKRAGAALHTNKSRLIVDEVVQRFMLMT